VASVRVPNFDPKVNGFIYPNAWPHTPIQEFKLGDVATLNIGDAANGLCGGMSFTTADLYALGRTPGDAAQPTGGDERYRYIVNRQITSFDDGRLPWRFFQLMSPTRSGRESQLAAFLGRFGVDRHSRTWTMIRLEWPAIQKAIDGGKLAMIGLVRIVSADPHDLSHNHQVLAYGYDTNGSTVVLRICDPNWPRDPNVTITFDTADPMGETKPLWSHKERDELQCFFTYAYQPIDPVPFRT